jgi:PAS domain S-box-containing protein
MHVASQQQDTATCTTSRSQLLTMNQNLSVLVSYLLCLIYTELWLYSLHDTIVKHTNNNNNTHKENSSKLKLDSSIFMDTIYFKSMFVMMLFVTSISYLSSRLIIYRKRKTISTNDTSNSSTTFVDRSTTSHLSKLERIFNWCNILFIVLAIVNITIRFIVCEGRIPFCYYMITPFLALLVYRDSFWHLLSVFSCLLVYSLYLPIGFQQTMNYFLDLSSGSAVLEFIVNVFSADERIIRNFFSGFGNVNATQSILGLIEIIPVYAFFLWMIYHSTIVKQVSSKSEAELVHRQTLLDILLNNLPCTLWSVDKNMNINFIRGKSANLLERYSGTSLSQEEGTKTHHLFNKGEERTTIAQGFYTQRHLLALKGETVSFPLDTSRAILQATVSPWRNDKGEIIGVVGIANDVTSLVKAENALRTSEEHYRSLVESIQDLIVKIDKNCTILFTNARHLAFLPKNPTEYTGENVLTFFEDDTALQEEARKHLETVFTEGSGVQWEWSVSVVDKTASDGAGEDYLYFSVRVNPIMKDDVVIAATFICTDTTEKKKAHESLLVAEKAKTASKSKSEFLRVLSHEIRNPLNSILGAIQLLSTTSNLSSLQIEYIEDVNESAKLLLAIIQDVLDMSKIEAGKLTLLFQPLSILDVVETTADMYSLSAFEKNLELVTYVDPRIPAELIGDKTRLGQIISNLCTNSIKFTIFGYIYITATLISETSDEATVKISCEDTGIGIPESELPKIFKPFSQLTANNMEHKGWGLGLAISDRLVKLMHGDIKVVSPTHGHQGSEFSFQFTMTKQVANDTTIPDHTSTGLDSIAASANLTKFGNAVVLVENEQLSIVLKEYMKVLNVTKIHSVQSEDELLNYIYHYIDLDRVLDLYDTAESLRTAVIIDSTYMHLIPSELYDVIESDSYNHMKLITLFGPGETNVPLQSANPSNVTMRKPVKFSRLMSALSERKNSLGSLMWDMSLDQRLLLNPQQLQSTSPDDPETREAKTKGRDKTPDGLEILIVEDNALNRKIVTRLLEKCGVPKDSIELAVNGQEAIDLVRERKRPFSAILMDLQMPVLDGKEATIAIRQLPDPSKSSIPIIALTANAWTNERETCLHIGFNDVVTKPITLDTLISTIKKVVNL